MSGRFEFRVFALPLHFERFRGQLAELLPEHEVEEGQTVYLFGGDADFNVKLRDGRLDLKRLLRREHGLEQWQPEPLAFPVDRERAAALVQQGWPLPAPEDTGWRSAAELLAAAEASADLGVAHLRKRRRHYGDGVLHGETVEIEVNGAALASLALESEEPGRLREATSRLALDAENVSYPRMLQYLSGRRPLPPDHRGRVPV